MCIVILAVRDNTEVKPRRARPEVHIYCVAALENGMTILLRTAPCNCKLQVTQRLQAINRAALKILQ